MTFETINVKKLINSKQFKKKKTFFFGINISPQESSALFWFFKL